MSVKGGNWLSGLYKKTRWQRFFHSFFSVLKVIVSFFFLRMLFSSPIEMGVADANYKDCILAPRLQFLLGWTEKTEITKNCFILIAVVFLIVSVVLFYLQDVMNEKLILKGRYYSRNIAIDKLRRLNFHEKKGVNQEINSIVWKDCYNIGVNWEHFINHIIESVFSFFIAILVWNDTITKLNTFQIVLALLIFTVSFAMSYLLTKKTSANEEKIYKMRNNDWDNVEKERINLLLIDSMGLNEYYKKKQQKTVKIIENFATRVLTKNYTLYKLIPRPLLLPILIISLLAGSNTGIRFEIFREMIEVSWNLGEAIKEYKEYKLAYKNIEKFLKKPEKDDNLKGIKLSDNVGVKRVIFEKVYFRYSDKNRWVLENYTKVFCANELTHLEGANGSGKSTKIYLLLGMLKPNQGKITVELNNGIKHDLSEINLLHWRSHNVAYMSHENLFERDFGSTGERQLANIKEQLVKKDNSSVWILDEAENALDQKNREWVKEEIAKLAEKGKIVIYITHRPKKVIVKG